jgi:beta-phosphoglucomutase
VIKGVIFDMDGVLADSEPLHAQAWVIVLRRYGIHVDERWFDRWIGIPNTETADEIVELYAMAVKAPQLVDERQAVYLDLVDRELRPFPGLAESIGGITLPMAVATSSTRSDAARILSRLGLAHHFRAVVTREDVQRPKPDAEVYARAAAALGLGPAECAAIEDSPAGVASAAAAGCCVLAVTTTHAAARLAAARRVYADTVSAIAGIAACDGTPG